MDLINSSRTNEDLYRAYNFTFRNQVSRAPGQGNMVVGNIPGTVRDGDAFTSSALRHFKNFGKDPEVQGFTSADACFGHHIKTPKEQYMGEMILKGRVRHRYKSNRLWDVYQPARDSYNIFGQDSHYQDTFIPRSYADQEEMNSTSTQLTNIQNYLNNPSELDDYFRQRGLSAAEIEEGRNDPSLLTNFFNTKQIRPHYVNPLTGQQYNNSTFMNLPEAPNPIWTPDSEDYNLPDGSGPDASSVAAAGAGSGATPGTGMRRVKSKGLFSSFSATTPMGPTRPKAGLGGGKSHSSNQANVPGNTTVNQPDPFTNAALSDTSISIVQAANSPDLFVINYSKPKSHKQKQYDEATIGRYLQSVATIPNLLEDFVTKQMPVDPASGRITFDQDFGANFTGLLNDLTRGSLEQVGNIHVLRQIAYMVPNLVPQLKMNVQVFETEVLPALLGEQARLEELVKDLDEYITNNPSDTQAPVSLAQAEQERQNITSLCTHSGLVKFDALKQLISDLEVNAGKMIAQKGDPPESRYKNVPANVYSGPSIAAYAYGIGSSKAQMVAQTPAIVPTTIKSTPATNPSITQGPSTPLNLPHSSTAQVAHNPLNPSAAIQQQNALTANTNAPILKVPTGNSVAPPGPNPLKTPNKMSTSTQLAIQKHSARLQAKRTNTPGP